MSAARRDRELMRLALRLAERGHGTTAPNPSVGAVIARDDTGEVLARGWTAPGGRPHAETSAIARLGPGRAPALDGATLYVTLEPCSHHGRTPPCADAIIAARFTRVVYGITDPDPRVAGRGLARMQAAGIHVSQVDDPAIVEAIHWATRGHIVRVTERRPLITLKLALGPRGEVPRGAGGPTWITGPGARARGHLLRATHDAILIGSGTLRDDDPELTCRLPGLAHQSPQSVVLSRRLDVSPEARLFRPDRPRKPIVYHGADAPPDRIAALTTAGATLAVVPVVGGRLWLPAVLEDLASRGITRLLVEGGPAVWQAFSRAGLVDAVEAFIATREPDTALAGIARHVDLAAMARHELRDVGEHDRHISLRLRPRR